MKKTVIECVPNFSEGRDRDTIRALLDAARSPEGAKLLDHTSDRDHNRTVLTIAGEPEAVAAAAFETIRVARDRIRLPEHTGVHPRIGAADVIPFVPIEGVSLAGCAEIARRTGQRVWDELGIPVFFYGAAASEATRARLETIRSASFEGLPDIGVDPHPTAGAAIVGARNFLIAWNINLLSTDLTAAREIARCVRQSSGGLLCVKALGLELQSRGQVQVSINITDFEQTPLHLVFETVREQAEARRIPIAGSELIGLIPQRALDLSAGHDLRWLIGDRIQDYVLERRLNCE